MKNEMLDRLIKIGPEKAFKEELVKIVILTIIFLCIVPFLFP